jgi:protein SCO1/2
MRDVSLPGKVSVRLARGGLSRRRALAWSLAASLLGLPGLLPPAAGAAGEAAPPAAPSHHLQVDVDPVRRANVDVTLGKVQLVREDGASVSLNELLRADRPVFVDFVYTTCTAICPVMSATFAGLEEKLGRARGAVNLISISIDPEEDTPRRLREFRKKYDASEAWHFYTGTLEASIAAQRAFGVFTGDKMLHQPVILYRTSPSDRWVRFDGFATPQDLFRELPPPLAAR